ncbi:MAG TPA: response regulator, partial [Polyangiaceae bacterium]|nr:response regulator [Polyangiaceae bacterium]
MSKNEDTLVLVADDEPSMLALLSAYIRSKGYRVLEASDGDMAWQLAHEHLPHAVVLDVMMPGMSGWEVCKKIRESVSLAHTGVVMLTGIGESLNELTSPLYGADAYIDKPFEFAELESKIKETLERRRDGALGRPDDGSEDDEDEETESDEDEDEDESESDDDEDEDSDESDDEEESASSSDDDEDEEGESDDDEDDDSDESED